MIEIKDMSCGYEDVPVIKNMSLSVEAGQNVSIIGPNGCGKTTLLKAMMKIIGYSGSIRLGGREIKELKPKEIARTAAYVMQVSDNYFPYTVFDAVSFGRYAHEKGMFPTLGRRDVEMVMHCIETVGLKDQRHRLIDELSGGQIQRVALARALAQDTDIILLDEPTNHLDLKYQIELLEYLKNWTSTKNKCVVAVLHDLNLVHYFADRAVLVHDGCVYADGSPAEVLNEENLLACYGINIKKFMQDTLEMWKEPEPPVSRGRAAISF